MHLFLTQFITIAVVHLLAVASPGPDFAVVVKNSVSYGRKAALYTSMGVGTGILIHVTYSLLGIGLIISQSILLFNIIKLLGAAYLIYIGIKSIKAKPNSVQLTTDQSNEELPSWRKAFFTGFMTNGLNPKATLFFLSLFTVIINPETPVSYQAVYGIYMAFATALWFSLVSLLFSQQKIRNSFFRIGHWFDRVMGGILIGLGIKLAATNLK